MDDIVSHHTESYSYDPADNRQTGPDKFDSYTYDNANELLTSTAHPHQNTQNEYDVNGNLIKKTETIGKWKMITSYIYDDENRLITIAIQKGDKTKEISFAYDPFGRRISKTIEKEEFTDDDNDMRHGHDNDGHHGNDKNHHHGKHGHNDYPKTTFYIYDNQNIIAEYDQNNTQTASYIYGPNIDEPLSADINNTRIYYHADGLGSITTLTNHMGHKVQQYDYDSFGNIKSTPFWIKQPYTYTGREFDYDTNLYYYRARYYDPQAGRFMTRDPIKFRGGINQYIYANNNPLRYLDSSGMWGWDVHFLMTFRIASQIPNLECYAYAIARNDQLVDEDERAIWDFPKYRPWNSIWHFPKLGNITHLLNIACGSCKAYDVGGALHVAQDGIAHASYSYGHLPWIDDAIKRPYEAQLTYYYTKNDLELISRHCDEIF